MDTCTVIIRHWLPIVTICPVNHLPDLIYISVTFDDELDSEEIHELYAIRKEIKKIAKWRKAFMEEIAFDVFNHFKSCKKVELKLVFSRHVISYESHEEQIINVLNTAKLKEQ